MNAVRVRGIALPAGEYVDLYADGDRWTTDPVAGATLAAQGWLLPGLVDAHTHPGAQRPGQPLDHAVLRADLELHVDAGVTLLRAPGLAGEPPGWFGAEPDLPRAVHAGPWFAQAGQFFDGWGRRPAPTDLPAQAAEQARRTGWAKVIGDWGVDDEPVPTETLSRVVAAVHAAGGRVAVHAQRRAGAEAAVLAGVDSLEHGMSLEPALLATMARQGTALTPTLAVLTAGLDVVRARPPGRARDSYLAGALAHPALVAAAAEAGVTLLAGTDTRPHGGIAAEVRALVAAGVPADVALGAGSWTARAYLGFGGLEPGAPADAVVYAEDPRRDLGCLEAPMAVVLRGRRVR